MKNFALMAMVIASFSLAACQTNRGDKEVVGNLGGAVAGGLLGAQIGDGSGQIIAAAAGTFLGAYLGGEIGRLLDKADMLYAQRATTQAHSAPIGESVSWDNPESGNYGSVTPTREGKSSYGRYCREYQQVITVGGRQEQGVGQACQNPDGTWEIIS